MIIFYLLARAVLQLIDPKELETLNKMFGEGNWVICWGCQKTPGYWCYHHREFHG